MENGVSDAQATAAFDGHLHLFQADEKSVGRHRADVEADLAPAKAEAENEGGGWGLEADKRDTEARRAGSCGIGGGRQGFG